MASFSSLASFDLFSLFSETSVVIRNKGCLASGLLYSYMTYTIPKGCVSSKRIRNNLY